MFKNERENFEIDRQAFEKEIQEAKAEVKRLDEQLDEPSLLYCNRSMQAIEAYDVNRDRDAAIERLQREMATMRSAIPLMIRTERPRRHEESGKIEILIDDSYDTAAPLRIAIREALELVPIYDGRNMTLLHFLRACRRGRDKILANCDFTQAVYSKLRGLAAEEDYCQSIDQIGEQLSYSFGSRKTVEECQGDLRRVFQKKGRKHRDLHCSR